MPYDPAPVLPPPQPLSTPPKKILKIASAAERFAAFFTDALILFYLGLGLLIGIKIFMKTDLTRLFTLKPGEEFLFGTSAAAVFFLYYLLFEGVLTASPGKLLAHLAVRTRKGKSPSLFAIVIRNIFRVVDYPLFFLSIALMELTSRRRRLGDFLANTIVVRVEKPVESQDLSKRGGATRRVFAFLLDAVWIVGFGYGVLLMIPANHPLLAPIGLYAWPGLVLLYFSLAEGLFQTTFGKAVLGLKLCREDGGRISIAAALLRNFCRLFDLNPLGYFYTFVSSHKQRPGDIVAGTLVIRGSRGLRGWMAVPYMMILAATVLSLGFLNPQSAWRQKLDVRVGPYVFDPFTAPLELLSKGHIRFDLLSGIEITSLEMGSNEQEALQDPAFEAGQVVYLIFRASGYRVKANQASFQADLKVVDSQERTILDSKNIIDAVLSMDGRTSAKMVTRFALNVAAVPGTYQATLTLRDAFAKTETAEKISFRVLKNPNF